MSPSYSHEKKSGPLIVWLYFSLRSLLIDNNVILTYTTYPQQKEEEGNFELYHPFR